MGITHVERKTTIMIQSMMRQSVATLRKFLALAATATLLAVGTTASGRHDDFPACWRCRKHSNNRFSGEAYQPFHCEWMVNTDQGPQVCDALGATCRKCISEGWTFLPVCNDCKPKYSKYSKYWTKKQVIDWANRTFPEESNIRNFIEKQVGKFLKVERTPTQPAGKWLWDLSTVTGKRDHHRRFRDQVRLKSLGLTKKFCKNSTAIKMRMALLDAIVELKYKPINRYYRNEGKNQTYSKVQELPRLPVRPRSRSFHGSFRSASAPGIERLNASQRRSDSEPSLDMFSGYQGRRRLGNIERRMTQQRQMHRMMNNH